MKKNNCENCLYWAEWMHDERGTWGRCFRPNQPGELFFIDVEEKKDCSDLLIVTHASFYCIQWEYNYFLENDSGS